MPVHVELQAQPIDRIIEIKARILLKQEQIAPTVYIKELIRSSRYLKLVQARVILFDET